MTTAAAAIAHATLGGAFAGNRMRLALSVLAIALGVALGYAVQLINRAALTEFATGLATLAGDADLEVRGPRGGFDERLFPQLARIAGVAVASPVVEIDARLPGVGEPLRIYGVDALRAGMVTPALIGAGTEALDLFRTDALFLSPAASAHLSVTVGDTLLVQSGTGVVPMRVAGLLRAGASLRYAVMDVAAVQDRFDRIGVLTRVDLRMRPGVALETVRARVAALLPPGVAVVQPGSATRATERMTRAYRVNLEVLALVALFTGALLVFSTQALAVVQRRTQFALVRTLGVTRARLTALVVAEGAALGLAGAAVGLVAGYALANLALHWFGADLGAGFFRGVDPELQFSLADALPIALLGVVAAALGSLAPALEAGRAAPAAALKAGDDESAYVRLRTAWPGFACLALGTALLGLPPVAGLPLAGYGAIALFLVGTLALLPRIATLLLARVPRPRPTPAALALDQLRGAPGQAGVSLAAMVASVALMVSMAIMVASFRHSLEDWLVRVLPADLYVRAGLTGDSAHFDAATQRAIADTPGVARAEFLRVQRLLLDPERAPVTLLARDVDPNEPQRHLPLVDDPVAIAGGAPPPAYASEAMADLYGHVPGQRITLPIGGRDVAFTVAALWRDYARQTGAVVIDRVRYIALTGDTSANDVALWLEPRADLAATRRELESRAGGADRVTIATPGDIRALSLRAFDRTFAVTYALEAAAVVIGLVALSATFGAQTLARRREFGMLRHIGMTRRQIGTMLACEGFAISAVALAVGLALGFVISLILIHVVNRQSFHWGMTLHLPWAALATLTLTLLALATLTAVTSARRAMSVDAVRAVKDDW